MLTDMRQLNVSITPYFSKFMQDKVKSGRYTNASEVLREALRRLEQEEMLAEQSRIVDPDNVREAVLQGLNSIERGDFTELSTQEDLERFFGDIVQRGKKPVAAKGKPRAGEALPSLSRSP
jgi:antitoxin ParD1/3/4